MDKPILYLLLVFLFTSCSKKIKDAEVENLSIDDTVNLNQIIAIGDRYVITGGEKFSKAKIYLLQHNQTSEINLPANSTQKEIYGIAQSPLGDLMAVAYDAGIYTSVDSGLNWQFSQSNIWQEFKDAAFVTNDSALIAGRGASNSGFMAKGDRNGQGFLPLIDQRKFYLYDVDAVNDGVCYCSGYGAILKSTDFGLTWNYTDAENDDYRAMCWRNKQEGLAVGFQGSIIKTMNGGTQWTFIRNANNSVFKRLHFLDVAVSEETVVAVGENGLVYVSTDFGEHWREMKKFSDHDFHGVVMINATQFVVVGSSGSIYRISL